MSASTALEAAASTSSRMLPSSSAQREAASLPCIQDKGKGRARSPPLGMRQEGALTDHSGATSSLAACPFTADAEAEAEATSAYSTPSSSASLSGGRIRGSPSSAESECIQTPLGNSCDAETPLSSSRHSNERDASTREITALAVPWTCSSKEVGNVGGSVGTHPYDPFSLRVEMPEQSSLYSDERRIVSLGLRRRPYQSGYSPLPSPSCRESVMTTIDRASIFAGLGSASQNSDRPGHLSEAVSSSKRSFEEANSPLLSSTRGRINRHGQVQESDESRTSSRQSSVRPFAASTSHLNPLPQEPHLGVPSGNSSNPQPAQRRLSNKRRRPLSRESSMCVTGTSNAGSSVSTRASSRDLDSPNGRDSTAMGDVASARRFSPSGSQRASVARSDRTHQTLSSITPSEHRASLTAIPQGTGAFEELESSFENVDLPTGTMNLLQRWWVDTEASQEPHSVHQRTLPLRDVDDRLSSRQDVSTSEITPRRDEHVVTAPSPTPSQGGERPDELQGIGTDYHDELMDVFRRLSGEAPQTDAIARPAMPPRSSSMLRSTTQMSGQSHQIMPEEDASVLQSEPRSHREVDDLVASYMDCPVEIRPDNRVASTTLLPSARAAYQSQVARSIRNRTAALQSQVERFEELARRNREVISRYTDATSSQRLRHAGSPTPPNVERHDEAARSETASGTTSDHQQHATRRDGTSQRWQVSGEASPSVADGLQDVSVPLWGEYFSTQSRAAGMPAPNNSESSITPSEAARSRFSSRFSTNNTALLSSSSSIRRRAGALGSASRLRGPTRRLNEEWMNIGIGEGNSLRADDAHGVTAHRATSRLEDEASVMSAYRQMQFPDPEATLALQNDTLGAAANQPPQLPSLRARSPLAYPFDNVDTGQNGGEDLEQDASLLSTNAAMARQPYLRPSLRPLTLSSRFTDNHTGSLRAYRNATLTSEDVAGEQMWTHRHSVAPDSIDGDSSSLSSLPSSSSRLRQSLALSEEASSRMSSALQRPRNAAVSQREEDRSDDRAHIFSPREQESPASSERSRADVHLSRRLTAHPDSTRHLRQRASASLYSHRRPTLLDSNSSAVDMEMPRTHQWQPRSNVFRAEREGENSQSRDRPSRFPSSPAEARLSSRLDRYLQELGNLNAEWRESHQEGLRSSSSTSSSLQSASSGSQSLFSLSQLPGGSMFGASLRSEIAMNPANYVADEDFALRDSYEGLLHLSAQIGDVRSKATPSHIIAKLPTCPYWQWSGASCEKGKCYSHSLDGAAARATRSPNKGKARAVDDEEERKSQLQLQGKDTKCSICLENYEDADSIMSLPCHHAFHDVCVSAWLKNARSCPICRGNVCTDDAEEKSKGATTTSPFHTMPWHRILPELNF